MAYFSNLTLFYKPTCPYCQKVLAFMEEYDINCQMKDVLVPGQIEELMCVANTRQVPCLIINGEPMLESDDIIAYLKTLVTTEEVG